MDLVIFIEFLFFPGNSESFGLGVGIWILGSFPDNWESLLILYLISNTVIYC